MKKVVSYIQSNLPLAVMVSVGLGFVIMQVSSFTASPITDYLQEKISLNFYTKNTVFKFFVLIYSILVILLVNGGKLNGYGFNRSVGLKYGKFTLNVLGITIAALILGSVVFMGLLNHLFPTGNSAGFPEQNSLIQMILTIWVWSSLCEEVLVRGFVQSFIQNFSSIKFLKLSLPVWISGLFFGSMHLSLIKAGMGAWFITFIVFNTTVIGLVAAYYREKTNSLVPAFWVHFLANFVGSIPLIIKFIVN